MIKLGILLTVFILAVTLTQGQAPQKSCRAVFSDMNRRQLTWINQCVKQLGYKTGREKTQKSACVMKCVLENLQLVNKDGFLDLDQFNKYLTTQWPDHLIDRANATFQPCAKLKRDESKVNDEFCKDIEPITKCLQRNFSNLCRGT